MGTKKQNKKVKQKVKHFYDRSYKNIFDNKVFIKALIEFCLPKELIKKIEWETIKGESTNFVPKDLKSREADRLYSIQLKNKEEVYVYFLLEFQVSVDKLMALRIFIYEALIYHHLLKMERIKKNAEEIPAVIPIILYIGDEKWDAEVRLSKLIDKEVYRIVREYIPDIS